MQFFQSFTITLFPLSTSYMTGYSTALPANCLQITFSCTGREKKEKIILINVFFLTFKINCSIKKIVITKRRRN